MCDTLVALGNATKNGSVIFAKNSDREPNEAHQIILIPSSEHPPGSQVRCTYVDIAQVTKTNAVLLAKPYWIWGAEMGANEHGVVIGNEAVFTKIPVEKGPSLIGMDYLRLALERGSSAREALGVITSLLEEHGQGGNCGYAHSLFYHNSFIIADPIEAWVLETADKHWAAEKVKDLRTISNRITIGSEFDLASEHLVDYAIDQGWCKNRDEFDFGRCYSDFLYTTLGDSYSRYCRTSDLLAKENKMISVSSMMQVLRDHGEDSVDNFQPGKGISGADVCMHASYGPIRGHQSVGSMISEIKPGTQTHWLTGTSAPCTGIFKPIWIESGIPDLGPPPGKHAEEDSLWWQHEKLHRLTLMDYHNRLNAFILERDNLELGFLDAVSNLGHEIKMRKELSQQCFQLGQEASERWIEKIQELPLKSKQPYLHRIAWRGFDKAAGFSN